MKLKAIKLAMLEHLRSGYLVENKNPEGLQQESIET